MFDRFQRERRKIGTGAPPRIAVHHSADFPPFARDARRARVTTTSLLRVEAHGWFELPCGAVAVAPRSSERPAASRDHWAMGRPLVRKPLGSLVFSPHRCGQPSGEFSQVSCRPYTVMSNSPYDGAITSLPRP